MSDDGGSGGYDYSNGDGGSRNRVSREEYLEKLTPSERVKFFENEKKTQHFVVMGASALLLALSVSVVALPRLGDNVEYSADGINFCSHSVHKTYVEDRASGLDRFANLYCEPVVKRYLSNEDNPNKTKDTDLRSDVAQKIANLRELYVPASKVNSPKNN